MTNEQFERILSIPIEKEKTIRTLADLQCENESMKTICDAYSVDKDAVVQTYIEEMLIPGMTVGIAWNTMSFLVTDIDKGSSASTLRQAVRDNILAAGIYMTNVPCEKRRELEGRV